MSDGWMDGSWEGAVDERMDVHFMPSKFPKEGDLQYSMVLPEEELNVNLSNPHPHLISQVPITKARKCLISVRL